MRLHRVKRQVSSRLSNYQLSSMNLFTILLLFLFFFMFEFPCIITLYYIESQLDATLAVLFISHCKITLHVSGAFCHVWVSVHHNSILYREPTRCNFGSIVYQSLQNYSTCFGRSLRPSSGVLKTVEAATGACHGSGWYISSKDVRGRLPLHYVRTLVSKST